MSFIDQIINGHRSVLKTLAVTWNYKSLLFYSLLSSLVSSFVFAVVSLLLGFGVVGIYRTFEQWTQALGKMLNVYTVLALGVVLIFNYWIKVIFSAALLRRVMELLHRKDMTFSESFDFGKQLNKKLFFWSVVFIVVVALILISSIYIPQVTKYYLVYFLLMVWFIGTLFMLPVLIKRNLSLGKAIKKAFVMAWAHVIEIISATIIMIFYMLLIGFIVGVLGLALTWLVCHLLNVPFEIGLTMPFILVIVVPTLLLGWYFATVIMALPATLYHSVVDGLK